MEPKQLAERRFELIYQGAITLATDAGYDNFEAAVRDAIKVYDLTRTALKLDQ